MTYPKYLQIFNDIKDKINREIIQPGNALPSENELAEKYLASRMTARRSLTLLKDYGYIYAVPGKGYYIRKPEQYKYILYFNEMDISSIDKKETKLLAVNITSPDEKLKEELQVEEETRIVVIKRLLFSHQKPASYDVKYLLYDRGQPVVEKEIQYATFPELISKNTSLFAVRKELNILCQPADNELSELLSVDPGYPLAAIEQKLINENNKPLGMGTTYIRGDFFHLKALYTNELKITHY